MARPFLSAMIFLGLACGGGDGSPLASDAGSDAGPPIPEVPIPDLWGSRPATDLNADPNVVEVSLTARFETITLGDGMTFEMMTYDGLVPGPVIQAKVGDEVIVHFENQLDQDTTIHWHGLRISDQMDGSPRIQAPVPPGGTFEYRFVVPEAGTFWYHPHVRPHVQIERGLYGMLVVRDALDPEYDLERMVTLDDIFVGDDAGMLYIPPHLASMPERMHGRYGNVMLTNGVEVSLAQRGTATQGDVERWRILNTANARTMELTLRGASFRVISSDGGKLAAPYTTERLLLAVGQRYDLEVSYDTAGAVELVSHLLAATPAGEIVETEVPVLAVDVEPSDRVPPVVEWPVIPPLFPGRVEGETVEMVFDVVADPVDGVAWRINGEPHSEKTGPLFTFREGDTVRMVLRNAAGPEHPFHLHGQFFDIVPNGQPWTEQPGLKDTVLVPGVETVEIIAYLDNPGRWMAHCHFLEHAELGFMGEIVVEPADGSGVAPPMHSGH